MCARTPIWCPICKDTLLHKPGRQAECLLGHTVTIDSLPIPAEHQVISQYHGSGRSQVFVKTVCNRCKPV